jgi:hypothetical protein
MDDSLGRGDVSVLGFDVLFVVEAEVRDRVVGGFVVV